MFRLMGKKIIIILRLKLKILFFDLCETLLEPWHGISNKVVCATSKASNQPAHTRSLIRAIASRLNMSVRLLIEHYFGVSKLKRRLLRLV